MISISRLFEDAEQQSVPKKYRKRVSKKCNHFKGFEESLPELKYPLENSQRFEEDLDEVRRCVRNPSLSQKFLNKSHKKSEDLFKKLIKDEEFEWDQLNEILDEFDGVVTRLKFKYDRSRPYVYFRERGEDLKTKEHGSPSFPSGHAAFAYFTCDYLANQFPHRQKELERLAELVCQSRIENGVHFPSDISAGRFVGEQAAKFINSKKKIKESFEYKRAEPDLLQVPQEMLTRFWFERRGQKKSFFSYVKSCPELYELLPSPYIIQNRFYSTEFWFTDKGLEVLSDSLDCLENAGIEDGWTMLSEKKTYSIPDITGVPGYDVPKASIVEPGLILAYRDDLQVAFYRSVRSRMNKAIVQESTLDRKAQKVFVRFLRKRSSDLRPKFNKTDALNHYAGDMSIFLAETLKLSIDDTLIASKNLLSGYKIKDCSESKEICRFFEGICHAFFASQSNMSDIVFLNKILESQSSLRKTEKMTITGVMHSPVNKIEEFSSKIDKFNNKPFLKLAAVNWIAPFEKGNKKITNIIFLKETGFNFDITNQILCDNLPDLLESFYLENDMEKLFS